LSSLCPYSDPLVLHLVENSRGDPNAPRGAAWRSPLTSFATRRGCNLKVGDVIGSCTVSGPTVSEAGALIELAFNTAAPLELATGEKRSFLEDGDTVALRGYCEKPGFARIGFRRVPGRGSSRPQVLRCLAAATPSCLAYLLRHRLALRRFSQTLGRGPRRAPYPK
jgi:hypothetical protein